MIAGNETKWNNIVEWRNASLPVQTPNICSVMPIRTTVIVYKYNTRTRALDSERDKRHKYVHTTSYYRIICNGMKNEAM